MSSLSAMYAEQSMTDKNFYFVTCTNDIKLSGDGIKSVDRYDYHTVYKVTDAALKKLKTKYPMIQEGK